MKTITKNWNYLKHVFWLSPILMIMGLSAKIVIGHWEAVSLGLLIAGVVVGGLWLVFESYFGELSPLNWWGKRSTQAGTNAFVSILAVLVILGFLNFLAVRHNNRIDLTENQLFTLAPQSQQVLNNLKQPVKTWVFDGRQNPQDAQLLESYRRQSPKFSFEFVDPQARPGLAEEFGIKNIGDVYLELPGTKRRQFLQALNEQQRLSESRVTNGLVQITSDRQIKAYFLQGHGEHPLDAGRGSLSQAVKALTEKNYQVEPLTLAERATVPADAAMVVVAGPQRALFDNEVKALQTYLKQGGSVLLMLDPKVDTKLDSLLKDWGVTLDSRVAVDGSGKSRLVGLPPTAPLITQYGDHPITKDFGNGLSFFYPLARPMDITPVQGVQQTPLLFTSPDSWAESDLSGNELTFDPTRDRKGPLLLGVALSRPINQAEAKSPSPTPSPSPSPSKPDEQKPEARLVVLGNSNFASDGLFGQQLNGDVFLNSLGWLNQQGSQTLSIRPKEAKNRTITLNPQQANAIAWVAMAILPILGFTAATLVWWKRR